MLDELFSSELKRKAESRKEKEIWKEGSFDLRTFVYREKHIRGERYFSIRCVKLRQGEPSTLGLLADLGSHGCPWKSLSE